ncbi:MAG: serine/threonine-protein phosphatase [Oscillospiraceae bacterium]|nr:serine/threonine-protein phosphatase [Oscillospiraceae bacterium]
MKLIESVKTVQKTTIIAIAKPILSFFGGVILAGSEILGEDSLLCAALVAALPTVSGFTALLGALITAIFTEITVGKVASLASAIIVFMTRFLFDGTSRRRYPQVVSIVAATSYFGCAIFAGATAGASLAMYIKIVVAGQLLGTSTYVITTVFKNGIRDSTKPQLFMLFAITVAVASSYNLSEILSFSVCIICVYKLTRERDSISSAAHSASLRLDFLESAIAKFPKFANPGSNEHSFECMTRILSLTEREISEELMPGLSRTRCNLICDILSRRTGLKVAGRPLPDGAVELYYPKTARISENAIAKAAEKARMGSEVELFRSETDQHIRFTVTPKLKWHFDAGVCQIVANSSEPDSSICGDRAEIWSFGVYSYLILSDGMGTGSDAGRVAKNLITSFKNLTEAGYSLESSLRLSSEYIRSCQSDESFATLDILSANLMTGEITIRKCGAGKSYIFSDGGITPIPQGGYPIGILEEVSLVSTQITLTDNLTVLMMTDGADCLGIEKLAEISQEQDKLSADDLAAMVTSEAHKSQKESYHDDITVGVVRLSKN